MSRFGAVVLAAFLLPGCVAGAGGPPRQYYVLEMRSEPSPPPARTPLPRTLLVSGSAASSFYDADSLVFSRAPGERAYYQFASWTERPSRRIALLAQRRLETRGGFTAIANITAGVNGDLLLNVILGEFYHDTAAAPAAVRVVLVGELVDLRARTLLGRRTFSTSAPVSSDDAPGAVHGFERATAEALDALVPWVEATAAKPAR